MGRDKTGMCRLALPRYLACLQTIHLQYSIAPCKRDVVMQSMLLEKFVDSYQHLIQPLEARTGLAFRSSRVTAFMPNAGKAKEDTAMALVMVMDG
ncbi:uncharacterized protein Bfra_008434 [Botrytis fragariae]|uniref:Uncharacterized protein n=1 Tax=Botrytis fragariae TaxID=1964551 RepID=A0A8H6AT86_9HELO|nr:uncharacterized protein Bfra_008434 [Botrytis fragariae]KAF5873156.1 hypothetical protein Bfra_008434 [Botrytis fragariae]